MDQWKGEFQQGEVTYDMDMNLQVSDQDGIYGTGVDDIGAWCCAGSQKKDAITFVKYYRLSHVVEYKGKMVADEVTGLDRIEGTWSIPEQDETYEGTFWMEPLWEGSFEGEEEEEEG